MFRIRDLKGIWRPWIKPTAPGWRWALVFGLCCNQTGGYEDPSTPAGRAYSKEKVPGKRGRAEHRVFFSAEWQQLERWCGPRARSVLWTGGKQQLDCFHSTSENSSVEMVDVPAVVVDFCSTAWAHINTMKGSWVANDQWPLASAGLCLHSSTSGHTGSAWWDISHTLWLEAEMPKGWVGAQTSVYVGLLWRSPLFAPFILWSIIKNHKYIK